MSKTKKTICKPCEENNCKKCLSKFNTELFWYCPYGKKPIKQYREVLTEEEEKLFKGVK
jgi:hypothetical protein